MTITPRAVLASALILFPVSLLLGRSGGVIPGKAGIPINMNTSFPGCGPSGCHSAFPNSAVKLSISTPSLSITKGAGVVPISVGVSGANNSSKRGGFSVEATKGTFVARAGTNVRVDSATNGRSTATHGSSAKRSWVFDFNPGSSTGLVSLFGTGNAVNGDGRTRGDAWGWYGPDSGTPGTPFRVFVNDTAVTAFGASCDGGTVGNSKFRFRPVLGVPKNAAVNSTFTSEVHNVNPGTATLGIFGLSNTKWGPFTLPLSLAGAGAKGCALRVSLDILAPVVTTGSGAGGGVGKHTWLIPNIASLRGLNVYLQEMVVDPKANGLGLVFSMGLKATIQ